LAYWRVRNPSCEWLERAVLATLGAGAGGGDARRCCAVGRRAAGRPAVVSADLQLQRHRRDRWDTQTFVCPRACARSTCRRASVLRPPPAKRQPGWPRAARRSRRSGGIGRDAPGPRSGGQPVNVAGGGFNGGASGGDGLSGGGKRRGWRLRRPSGQARRCRTGVVVARRGGGVALRWGSERRSTGGAPTGGPVAEPIRLRGHSEQRRDRDRERNAGTLGNCWRGGGRVRRSAAAVAVEAGGSSVEAVGAEGLGLLGVAVVAAPGSHLPARA